MTARCDVVQVLLSPRIGGAETLAATLQAEWRAMGLRAETVYLDETDAGGRPLDRVRALRRRLRELRPGALLAHSALPNIYARMAAPRGIAVCTVMHGGDDFANPTLRAAEHVLRLRTTAVVTVSEEQRRIYRSRFGRGVPVVRISNAISPTMRVAEPLRPVPAVAVTVARVAPQKQPAFWADVTVAARSALPDLRFEWWGPQGDGPEVEHAATTAASAPNADLLGGTDAAQHVYAAADLLFHPAKAEAQSIGLLEAAASGLPIVCSDAVADTLDERVPRFSYPVGDVDGAIAALRAAVADWPAAAVRAREVAPLIQDGYSARVCALRYLEVLGLEGSAGA